MNNINCFLEVTREGNTSLLKVKLNINNKTFCFLEYLSDNESLDLIDVILDKAKYLFKRMLVQERKPLLFFKQYVQSLSNIDQIKLLNEADALGDISISRVIKDILEKK